MFRLKMTVLTMLYYFQSHHHQRYFFLSVLVVTLLLLLTLLALVDKDDMRRGGSIKCGLATIPSLKSNRLRIASADDDLLLMAMTLVVDLELPPSILLDVMVAMI